MSTSAAETVTGLIHATGVYIGDTEFAVLLTDGRRVVIPLAAFPRLAAATPVQRRHVELYSDGKMLHWPDLDEDIAVQHLIEGRLPVKQVARGPLARTGRANRRVHSGKRVSATRRSDAAAVG
jgi:hypothetical protein